MSVEDFSFETLKEFDNHRLVTFLYNPAMGLTGFIAIHRGGLVRPAFGATRIWRYSSELEALKDTLKLSRMMSYKSALAGLQYGGAKAVLLSFPNTPKKRKLLLKSYAHRVNYLSGHFITGADVGVNDDDLKVMASESQYMVGLKSDPVKFTSLGVFYSIQACLKEVFGSEDIVGRTFAIQGLGKTGMGILRLLYKDAKKIFVSDIDRKQVRRAKADFPKIEVVKPSEIDKLEVDLFSPCALSNAINFNNISRLRCKIIVGSANSQLEDNKVGELLYKLGILYGPDYVVNAGGLITVVDEYENGNSHQSRASKRVGKIKGTLKAIISQSKKSNKATNLVADEMAEKIISKFA